MLRIHLPLYEYDMSEEKGGKEVERLRINNFEFENCDKKARDRFIFNSHRRPYRYATNNSN